MIKAVVLALVLLLSAGTASAEWSLAGGADIVYNPGKPMIEMRYFGETWSHWSAYVGTDQTLGAELYASKFKFDFGLGVEYAKSHADNVDTPFAYHLRLEYKINDHWGIGIKHRSNCKQICDTNMLRWAKIGDEGSINKGFNYLYLRRRF